MKTFALDIETYDPNLKVLGPGGVRSDGYIVAIALYDVDEKKMYYFNKQFTGFDEFPIEDYENSNVIGANVLYDIEWIHSHFGIKPRGEIIDIQLVERIINPIVDSVKLDTLSNKYLGVSKQFDEIDKWFKDNNKLRKKDEKWKGKAIENMHVIPAHLVQKYCEADCIYANQIWDIQKECLQEHHKIFTLERDILHVLLDMRLSGVPFTGDSKLAGELKHEIHTLETSIKTKFGIDPEKEFNIKKKDQKEAVAQYCVANSILFTRTKKNKTPQFVKGWYDQQEDPVFAEIKRLEEIKKLKGDYIDKLAAMSFEDHIYCVFHPYKTDENGTVTGRFASTNPNLQQIPIRNPKIGKIIRSQFYAPDGYVWVKADYSQQEVRYLVHLGCMYNNADALRVADRYYEDQTLDFYNVVTDLCHKAGKEHITRSHSKTILLGVNYGMGAQKLADSLDMELADAKGLKQEFLRAVPMVNAVKNTVTRQVTANGCITTINGRNIPFNKYELDLDWDVRKKIQEENPEDERLKTFSMSELREKHNDNQKLIDQSYRVAYAYKGLNYIIQGSCADITKQAMINCHRAGLTPVLTVHDELDFVLPDDEFLPQKIEKIRECMENTFKLQVPMKVDIEVGTSWGELKEWKQNEVLV